MNGSREEQKKLFYHVNYAHRGLHSKDKTVPENSLAAFKAAHDAGYGAELDVQLSKDGQVVVFHDETLDRVCRVHGKVVDFDYEDLKKMRLLDTEETIPLFTEVLDTFYGAGPLIVELKTSGKRNKELCEKTLKILRGYKGVFCVESFDPRIVYWFKKNAPDIIRGQLAMSYKDYKKEGWPAIAAKFLSKAGGNIFTKPDFNAYDLSVSRPKNILKQNKKGIMLVAWTSHDPVSEKDNDAVIFEFYHPELTY